jgi:hypothetical protein
MGSRSKGAKHSIAVAAALFKTLHFDVPVIPRSMPSAIELYHLFRNPITAVAKQQKLDAICGWGGQ